MSEGLLYRVMRETVSRLNRSVSCFHDTLRFFKLREWIKREYHSLNAFQATFFGRKNRGGCCNLSRGSPPPFLLWEVDAKCESFCGVGEPSRKVILWPDGIRRGFFWVGVQFSVAYGYIGYLAACDRALQFTWLHFSPFATALSVAVSCAFLASVSAIILYPWAVFGWYGVRRRPVLAKIWKAWPEQFSIAYCRAASQDMPAEFSTLNIIRALFRPIARRRDPSRYLHEGSVQNALQRIACNEYFSGPSETSGSRCNSGFIHWLVTRCGPVVIGQALMLLLGIAAYALNAGPFLVIPAVIWAVFSTTYLLHAVCNFQAECRVSIEDLRRIPYLTNGIENAFLLERLPHFKTSTVLSFVSSNLALTILLSKSLEVGPSSFFTFIHN